MTERVVYPDSDSQPIADDTKQFRWIVLLKESLDASLPDFVAGAHLWYPVEGRPDIRIGPDVMVCLGRPKGDRGSYQQWAEGGLAPQVVIEVISANSEVQQLIRSATFYARYGVGEVIYLDVERAMGWAHLRTADGHIVEVETILGWTSPNLGIRFEQVDGELAVFGPGGRRFLTWGELEDQRRAALQRAEAEAQRAEAEAQRAARLAEKLRAMGVDPESL
ncbi:MAG TPA: Uma2 family endonuclease [Myxococcota bacterium]|nr:Uma2 family endonuclease [Myxococcota bacterium]